MKLATAAGQTTRIRAEESLGQSNSDRIYQITRELLDHTEIGVLYDVGCGNGNLFRELKGRFERYVGVDLVRYEGFPEGKVEFIQTNLERPEESFPVGTADTVCCLETIEHVENPRALLRGLVKLLKVGGNLVVSTPNQLSWLSKLGLVLKNEFVQFQERPGLYPSHLSALLECDLRRMARENELGDVQIRYSGEGRMPGTAAHWPAFLSAPYGWRGRAFSDNVFLVAKKVRGT